MSFTTQSTTHGTAAPSQAEIQHTLLKVMYLGLAYALGLPALLLTVGYFVRMGTSEIAQPPEQIMFYALLAVALMEIPTSLFLKKIWLKPFSTSTPGQAVPTTAFVFSRYLVMMNLAAACSAYGFVWYLLGGTLSEFALFAVIGLIIFRLVRPSTEFFFSLFGVRPAIE